MLIIVGKTVAVPASHRTSDVWERVAARRVALADRVAALDDAQLDGPSWCGDWRGRDVLGHLVQLAEATQRTMARDIVTNGVLPNRAIDRMARRTALASREELVSRLRAAAGGRFHVVGTPAAVALGEILVHSEDVLRPLGHTLAPPADDSVMVFGVYRRIARVAFRAKLPRVRLVADDIAWSAGDGPEVHGHAIDLLLLLANRPQVLPSLHGDGVAALG